MITSETTLLLILMVPIVAFAAGALMISAWSQTKRVFETVNITMTSHSPRHATSILHNVSR